MLNIISQKKMKMWVDNYPPRKHGFVDESLSAGGLDIPKQQCVIQKVPETPRTTQAIAITFGCPP